MEAVWIGTDGRILARAHGAGAWLELAVPYGSGLGLVRVELAGKPVAARLLIR
jgi:hypothetical protein